MVLRITDLPIDERAKGLLEQEGFKQLYPPQELAVKSGLLEGENLVVASPTASGKTLIAMLAAIRHFSEKLGKTVYLTPLRALASEKYQEFKLMEKLGAKVRISTGDYDTPGYELRDADVIITTNEKMDSLLRHSSPWIKEISLIVADEIHLIGFEDRGPTLEVLITRLLHEIPNAQILALSATVSNAYEIAEWLDAKVININWRPVPLKEGVFFQHKIYFANGEASRVRRLTGSPRIDLVLDEIMNGGQAIAFMRTRTDAVKTAIKIAEAIKENPLIRRSLNETELKKLSDRVLVEGERTRLSDILSSLIKFGVAFHHAGLSSIHRSLIEDAFREGKLKALTATPTLAAGVNLPSRRVIITYLSRYSMGFSQPLSVFEYKQMAGRAGRPRYDEYGEAVLIARSRNEMEYLNEAYVMGEPERITSRLVNREILEMHVLGLIASKQMIEKSEVLTFFENTLCYKQHSPRVIKRELDFAIRSLIEGELVDFDGDKLFPTKFGKRVSELYISPSTGILFKRNLEKISGDESSLQYLLLICKSIDMPLFSVNRREIRKIENLIMELGIIDEELHHLSYDEYIEAIKGIKTAIVLNEWIDEVGEDRILVEWGVEPGDIHSAAYSAEWLLYAASQIASLLNNFSAAKALKILSDRMRYGVREELLELVQLQGIGRVRARLLYRAGFKSIKDIAAADLVRLTSIPGIGATIAKSIRKHARELMKQKES